MTVYARETGGDGEQGEKKMRVYDIANVRAPCS